MNTLIIFLLAITIALNILIIYILIEYYNPKIKKDFQEVKKIFSEKKSEIMVSSWNYTTLEKLKKGL